MISWDLSATGSLPWASKISESSQLAAATWEDHMSTTTASKATSSMGIPSTGLLTRRWTSRVIYSPEPSNAEKQISVLLRIHIVHLPVSLVGFSQLFAQDGIEPLLGVVWYLHNKIEATYCQSTGLNLRNESKVFLVPAYLWLSFSCLCNYMGADSGFICATQPQNKVEEFIFFIKKRRWEQCSKLPMWDYRQHINYQSLTLVWSPYSN